MSDLYDSISPEQRDAYLANAEQAFNEAVDIKLERVMRNMGKLMVQDAVEITKADAGDVVAVTEGMESLLPNPDLLTDTDKNFLLVHDVASRRANGEYAGKSYIEVLEAMRKGNDPNEPKNIGEEFAQKYLASED